MNSTSTFPLDRVAIQLGGITVYWYGIIIGFGIVVGLVLVLKEGKKLGVSSETIFDLLLYVIPISILTARLYYVLFTWDYYRNHLNEIVAIWQGGIAIHGAIIGASITILFFCKKRMLSFWKIADLLAPSLIIGQAIGRWGNFMNQEAHGGSVSLTFLKSLKLPNFIINQMNIDSIYYHPTFLYESIWNLIGFLILITIRRFKIRRGEIFLAYLIWYSIGRFFIEGLRTDSLMITSSLKMAQLISLLLITFSVMTLVNRRVKDRSIVHYSSES